MFAWFTVRRPEWEEKPNWRCTGREAPLDHKGNREHMTQIMCKTYHLQIKNETFYVPTIFSTIQDCTLLQTLLHLDLVDRDLTEYFIMILSEREHSEINTVEYGIVRWAEERVCYTTNEYDTELNYMMKIIIERGHSDATVECGLWV